MAMGGRRAHYVRLYEISLLDAFHKQPSAYKKFYELINDTKERRVSPRDSLIKVEEIVKDYPKLILGFSVFATGVYRGILDSDDEANKGLGQFQTTQTMVGKRVAPSPSQSSSPTMDYALRYMISVEEAFFNEPAKYDEFVRLMLLSQTIGESIAIAKVEKLTKDHRNLLVGFSVFLSEENKMSFFPNKRIRTHESHGAEDFTNKRKTRSQGLRDAIAAAQADFAL
ncbi:unnamed protein product [Microthlaspi erraticum]|uniref:Uncharacterized protein n=1 Tax=Microthlaspi erraticum TaxID=1685480 RepID=A0A6D2IAH2_9BRAS|nr:unnamed protein product [Microthlaspi erraticum]